jgi:hypothetical protein
MERDEGGKRYYLYNDLKNDIEMKLAEVFSRIIITHLQYISIFYFFSALMMKPCLITSQKGMKKMQMIMEMETTPIW